MVPRDSIQYDLLNSSRADSANAALAARVRRGWLQRNSLVVGNPVMPRLGDGSGTEIALSPLPGAEVEAVAVSRLLETTPLIGEDASEGAVRRRIGAATTVHLATHGLAVNAREEAGRSFVALAPAGSDDGLLTVEEVLTAPDLELSASLVTLSACETGLGNISEAEGIIGLTRAFLVRGAATVLVSQWSVDDEAAQLLMRQFYQHLLNDADLPSKTESLRRAQNDVRNSPKFHAASNWAAFQLVGAW
jgi:CHAT domain-containing protein